MGIRIEDNNVDQGGVRAYNGALQTLLAPNADITHGAIVDSNGAVLVKLSHEVSTLGLGQNLIPANGAIIDAFGSLQVKISNPQATIINGANTLAIDASGNIGVKLNNGIIVAPNITPANGLIIDGSGAAFVKLQNSIMLALNPNAANGLIVDTNGAALVKLNNPSINIINGANTLAIDASGNASVKVSNQPTIIGVVNGSNALAIDASGNASVKINNGIIIAPNSTPANGLVIQPDGSALVDNVVNDTSTAAGFNYWSGASAPTASADGLSTGAAAVPAGVTFASGGVMTNAMGGYNTVNGGWFVLTPNNATADRDYVMMSFLVPAGSKKLIVNGVHIDGLVTTTGAGGIMLAWALGIGVAGAAANAVTQQIIPVGMHSLPGTLTVGQMLNVVDTYFDAPFVVPANAYITLIMRFIGSIPTSGVFRIMACLDAYYK